MLLHPTLHAIGQSAVENVRSAGDDVNVVVMLSFAHLKVPSLIKVGTAGPSAPLRSGRDDKGEGVHLHRDRMLNERAPDQCTLYNIDACGGSDVLSEVATPNSLRAHRSRTA